MLLSSVCCVDCKRSTCEQAERRSGGDVTRGYLERTHLLPLLPQQLLQLAHALTLLLELGAEARLGAIGHRGGLAHARGCGAAEAGNLMPVFSPRACSALRTTAFRRALTGAPGR